MASTTPSSKRRQFTPRKRSVQDKPRPSRSLSVVLVGIGVAVTLVIASWLGFLHQSRDSKLEIKDVKIAARSHSLARAIKVLPLPASLF